jgi:hypothetical protein
LLEEFLANPVVQGGVAPFLTALVVTLVLQGVRLAGLAVFAAFLTCMYLTAGLQLSPLTATRKLLLVGVAAPLIGMVADFAFKSRRSVAAVLAAGGLACALWVFLPVLARKPAWEAWLTGAAMLTAVVLLAGWAQSRLAADAVRAGAGALAAGLGVGIAAIISASASYGLYGIALGAGAGGFLLPQMILGRRFFAGATFAFTAMLLTALIASGAAVLAQLPWYALLVLAFVPMAACLPTPARAPVWLQAVLCSLYSFSIAAIACLLAWPS